MGPTGRATHGAVAEKISFIAATTFGLEAVLGLSAELADAGSRDIRIEAALAKLWSSEMAWQVADELVQIRVDEATRPPRPGREGERAVHAEQRCETSGSTGLRGLHRDHALLIAREAVDAHLRAAGALADADAALPDKVRAARRPAVSMPSGCRNWPRARAPSPGPPGVRTARPAPAIRRAVLSQGWPGRRSTGCPAGRPSWSTSRIPGPHHRHRGRFAMAAACSRAKMLARRTPSRAAAYALADAFCAQARLRADHLFDRLWTNTDATDRKLAQRVLDGDCTWLEGGVLDQSEEPARGSPLERGSQQGGNRPPPLSLRTRTLFA